MQEEKNSAEYYNGRSSKRLREYSRTKKWDNFKKKIQIRSTIFTLQVPGHIFKKQTLIDIFHENRVELSKDIKR